MDKVSGLRDISCKHGRTMMVSFGLRFKRSWNDAAMVDMARRSEDDTRMEGGADGSLRRIWSIFFSAGSFVMESGDCWR